MNAYHYQLTDPFTGSTGELIVFAESIEDARWKLERASLEVNGPGLPVQYKLRNVTGLTAAASA